MLYADIAHAAAKKCVTSGDCITRNANKNASGMLFAKLSPTPPLPPHQPHLAANAYARTLPLGINKSKTSLVNHENQEPTVSKTLCSMMMRSLDILKWMPGRSMPLW